MVRKIAYLGSRNP